MFSVSSVSFSSSMSEMDAWSWLPLLRSELIVTIGRRGSNSFSLSEATAALNCGGLFFRRYNFDLSVLEYWFVPWLGEKVCLLLNRVTPLSVHIRAFSFYLIIVREGRWRRVEHGDEVDVTNWKQTANGDYSYCASQSNKIYAQNDNTNK